MEADDDDVVVGGQGPHQVRRPAEVIDVVRRLAGVEADHTDLDALDLD